jgi:hypothetical protein
VTSGATAAVLAAIPWAPAGPLPRTLEPLEMSSIPRPGPRMNHVAASSVRTLPDGAICMLGASHPSSGEYVALRIDAGGVHQPARLGPSRAHAPGWRLLDFLGGADDSWTLLELAPGPPDQVLVRRIAADGTTLWQSAATAGASDALRGLLGDRAGAVFAVTEGTPPRLVMIDAGGLTDVLQLSGASGPSFMNGRGRMGFVAHETDSDTRSWVTVDVDTGTRSVLGLDPGSAWGLDLPLGMDGQGRPYGNRYGTIVRFDADGQIDWELEVQDLVVNGQEIWVGQSAQDGRGAIALSLSGRGTRHPRELKPSGDEPSRRWRLVGHAPPESFLLYSGGDGAGTVATVTADGSVDISPASDDVWLRSFDLQVPSAHSVTDAGEVDLVTRGPDALHVVRVTPAS